MRTARLVLFVIGAGLVIAGIVNLIWPGQFFPSAQTCVHNGDTTACYLYQWAAAPLVAVVGIALMALAVLPGRRTASDRLRERRGPTTG